MANQSQTITFMSTKRNYHAGVAIDSECYVVIGGMDDENNGGLKTLKMLNRQPKQWIDIPLKMSFGRYCCSACFINGKIYVIGSDIDQDGGDVMEVLDLENEISMTIQLNSYQIRSAIVGLDESLYLFGGLHIERYAKNSIQEQTNGKIFPIFHQTKSFATLHLLVILFLFLMAILDLMGPSTYLTPKYRNGSKMTCQTYPKKDIIIQSRHLMIVTLSYRVDVEFIV